MKQAVEKPFDPVGAFQQRQKLAEPLAHFQPLAQRLDLLYHRFRLEIAHAPKPQSDSEPSPVLAEPVIHLELQCGLYSGHDLIEVVAIDLDKRLVVEWIRRFSGRPAEVGQDAHDER